MTGRRIWVGDTTLQCGMTAKDLGITDKIKARCVMEHPDFIAHTQTCVPCAALVNRVEAVRWENMRSSTPECVT